MPWAHRGEACRVAAPQVVPGSKQMEGAGVRICRTLGTHALRNLDPFLLLDEMKSPAENFPGALLRDALPAMPCLRAVRVFQGLEAPAVSVANPGGHACQPVVGLCGLQCGPRLALPSSQRGSVWRERPA